MDLHLKNLFGRFQDQFGSGPGLGPGSGVCLMKVEGITSNIIQSIFKASASLYRSEPWKRLRPSHLFGVRVGKDSDWSGKRQPFQCVQFIGGNGGDVAIYMYRSINSALKMTQDSWEMTKVPKVEVFRVTYEVESLMFPSNKRMVKSLCLEVSGTDRFPVFDVARCMTSGELQFRTPTVEELRLVFAVMKAVSLVHPLLQEEKQVKGLLRMVKFSPFIETVDVQWPSEMCKGHGFVAVTVSYPPGQSYEQKSKKLGVTSDTQSESWGGLEDSSYPQDLPIQNLNNRHLTGMLLLSNWSDYYDLRCLPPSSPVCDILSYPLTVYYILTTLSIHCKNLLLEGKEVTVHYLGPEQELDWIKAFAEINHLLNGSGTVQIIMIGPQVPSELSGTIVTTSATNNRIKLSFVKGLYQDEVTYLTSPDIIVALNCDMDGYSSWIGAVEVVKNMRIPSFFTDKTEDACGKAKAMLHNAGLNITRSVAPNPFRSPVRSCAESSNIPCYSNGFILRVNT